MSKPTEKQLEAIFALTAYTTGYPTGYWSTWKDKTRAEASAEIDRLKREQEEKKAKQRAEDKADVDYAFAICRPGQSPAKIYQEIKERKRKAQERSKNVRN